MGLGDYYHIYSWPDDPSSLEGQAYQTRVSGDVATLLSEPSLTYLWEKSSIRILDVCSGVGMAGATLAYELAKNPDRNVGVTLLDARECVFEKTFMLFEGAPLPLKWDMCVQDARQLDWQGEPFDIVLMYGLSLAHFNPFEWVNMLKKINKNLISGGVVLVHETDRKWLDCIENPYQKVAISALHKGDPIFSVFDSYDPYTGMVKRQLFDPIAAVRHEVESFPWGISEAGAIMMSVLGHVKMVPLPRQDYWIMGYKIL